LKGGRGDRVWKRSVGECRVLVAHACNPGYSGGRDQEDQSSKPVQANSSLETLSQKYSLQKRAGGVAQGEGLEFKSLHCKKYFFKIIKKLGRWDEKGEGSGGGERKREWGKVQKEGRVERRDRDRTRPGGRRDEGRRGRTDSEE
jgi:hypothetical protein